MGKIITWLALVNYTRMSEEAEIHGSILCLFKKFIEETYNTDTWLKVNRAAGAAHATYDRHATYPYSELTTLIRAAANYVNLSDNDLKEKFGEHLVPDLLTLYQAYLNPLWKTFDLLVNTELVMHKAVRKQEKNANPPILNVSRVHDKLLIIDYYSTRKMASLAVGIIKGIAAYYHEGEKVHIVPTTNLNDERVQIRVEFKDN